MSRKQWHTMVHASRQSWIWLLAGLLILLSVSLSVAYVQTSNNGNKSRWPGNAVTFGSHLGCPQSPVPCWDEAARRAAQAWNAAGANFQFSVQQGSRAQGPSCPPGPPDEINSIGWMDNNCGNMWPPGIVAFTGVWFRGNNIGDTDIIFNNGVYWDVYTGPIQFAIDGEPIFDLHRIAMHEFGHALGLSHPDDHGQNVRAIMHSTGMNHTIERLQPDDIAGINAIYGSQAPTTKGNLENPRHQTFKSGIGTIFGWVCEANRVEVAIGQIRFPAVYGSERPDTRGQCGDANNGFVLLFNWNILGDGVHTARLVVDGRMIGSPAEFKVTTFGYEVAPSWWEGTYWLLNFPRTGNETLVGWDHGTQNFSVLDRR